MSFYKSSITVIVGLISIGVILGVVLTTNLNIDNKSHAGELNDKVYMESDQTSESGNSQSVNAGNFNPNNMFVNVVEKVRPSIVSIYTAKNIKAPQNPFHQFFRGYEGAPNGDSRQNEMKQEGLGSGIIISEDGYILTNYHVVNDMDELKVRLIDNMEYPAKVVGADQSTEVALIKIEAKKLPVAVLGNSDRAKVGEWVIAIGNPLHLNFTVTAGIVSALSRDVGIINNKGNTGIENFIQTDAAINPGNSGGALVNMNGEVIGINTAIATQTRYYMGYGFAIPISLAKRVIDDLMKYGEFRRGYIGVNIEPVSNVIAEYVGLDKPKGVHISNVISGSAAEGAGLMVGDIILEVEGVEVNQPNELQAKVSMHKPGDDVRMVIWRDKKRKNVSIKLATMDNITNSVEDPKKAESDDLPELGIQLRDLTESQLNSLDLNGGIVVANVSRYSPAGEARLTRGDVIYKVEGKDIKSVEQFYDIVSEYNSGDVIKLHVRIMQNREIYNRLAYIKIP